MGIQIIIPACILNDKHVEITKKCIYRVEENTHNPYELIIVENGYKKRFDGITKKYWHSKEIHTYSQNVNIGLKMSDAEYVVVLSNDVFVNDGWDEFLLDCFNEKQDCGIATLLSSQFNIPKKDEIVEGFFGGIWMIKKNVIRKIGLLDERFINSFEDADYWVRTLYAGYKLYQNNVSIVEHMVRQTSSVTPDNLSDNKNYVKNRELFNVKHKDCNFEIMNLLR